EGIVFRTGVPHEEVTVLAHAQVAEAVFLQNVFERIDDERIFGEFRHGSRGEGGGGWANELAGKRPVERMGLEPIPVTNESEHLRAKIGGAVERAMAQHSALQ